MLTGFVIGDRGLGAAGDTHPAWMMAHTVAGPYLVVGASAVGQIHLARGLSRDDGFVIRSAGPWLAAAVADGVGSRPYSRYGATYAVEALTSLLLRSFVSLAKVARAESTSQPSSSDLGDLAPPPPIAGQTETAPTGSRPGKKPGQGMAHADIHLKNFLANPLSGEVVLIDLDGLVVKGFLPPQVKGLLGFIAPEVMMGKTRPEELTDRHSLAVLVLWVLLLHNVMQTQKCYDPDDTSHDDELGYGQYACFSENPHDRCNWIPRIGTPLFRNGALSYRSLTPKLQELTERALIHGLHDPPKRPQVVEWERALAEAYDTLVSCPTCRQSFFYPYWLQPPPRRQCPFYAAWATPGATRNTPASRKSWRRSFRTSSATCKVPMATCAIWTPRRPHWSSTWVAGDRQGADSVTSMINIIVESVSFG